MLIISKNMYSAFLTILSHALSIQQMSFHCIIFYDSIALLPGFHMLCIYTGRTYSIDQIFSHAYSTIQYNTVQ